jgi:hypothetical protein
MPSRHRITSVIAIAMMGALLLASSIDVARAEGEIGCPCIDVTEHLQPYVERTLGADSCKDHSGCSAGDCLLSVGQDSLIRGRDGLQQQFCFNVNYGSSNCAKHDENVGVCADATGASLSNAPVWCSRPWCYVNHTVCKENELFYTRSHVFPQLYYSYQTCGSDPRTTSDLGAALDGRFLKAGMPSLYYPMLYKVDEQASADRSGLYEDESVEWKGVVPEYVDDLVLLSKRFSTQGIAGLQYTTVSNASRAWVYERDNTKSSYTACVDDVENGRVDICPADFWITSDRLARVPFAGPMRNQKIQLFIPQGVIIDPPLKEMLGAVFRPFEPSVWVLIGALAVGVGLLDMWLNSNQWRHEITEAERTGGKNAAAIQYLTIALRHSYAGAFAFANGNAGSMKELRDENSSGPSRMLKLGWAFFIIIALGSYTANLAAFLTGQQKIAETWQTMEDAATYGKVICTHNALRFEVKSAYPENVFRYEVDQKSILNAYDRGECDGYFGIMDEFYISQDLLDHVCRTNMRAYQVVFEMPLGMPAVQWVANGMNVLIGTSRSEAKGFEHYLERYAVASNCTVQLTTQVLQSADTTPLDIYAFSGTILLILCASFLAVSSKVIFGEDDHTGHLKGMADGARRLSSRFPRLSIVSSNGKEVEAPEGQPQPVQVLERQV